MTPPKGKQRSIHMDDETFDLLQSLAAKHKINNSSVVRMALAAFAEGGQPRPVAASPLLAAPYGQRPVEDAATQQTPAPAASSILPDPRVSSFNVSGGKVRGKIARNEREDDGLDV